MKRHTKKPTPQLSRRQFLRGTFRGLPVFIAMPTLISLLPKEAWGADTATAKNFFFMYIPDGTFPHKINVPTRKIAYDHKMSLWYPTPGAALPTNLPLFLKKLEAYRNDFSLLSGFRGFSQGHLAPAYFLTGNSVDAATLAETMVFPNDSIDQIIGSKLAGGSKKSEDIKKYVVNAELPGIAGGTPLHLKLSHHMTFLNKQPTLSYTSPSNMFENIFGTVITTDPTDNAKYQKSLDLVMDDIKAKKLNASAEDKETLDRWLASYEELHAKFDPSAVSAAAANLCDTKKPAVPAKNLDASIQAELFGNYDKICRANMDIMLAAMECGARRVCTLMMMTETTKIGSWDKVIATEDLHSEAGLTTTISEMKHDKHVSMAHYGEDGSDMIKYMRLVTVNNYFMRQYAYMIDQLKTRQMINDTLAICSYSFRDGNHGGGNQDYPVLVAGKAGGFKTGFHHRVIPNAPEDVKGMKQSSIDKCRPLGNLWSSVLKKLYGIDYNVNADGNVNGLFG